MVGIFGGDELGDPDAAAELFLVGAGTASRERRLASPGRGQGQGQEPLEEARDNRSEERRVGKECRL